MGRGDSDLFSNDSDYVKGLLLGIKEVNHKKKKNKNRQ
jgi:hypothetical protein